MYTVVMHSSRYINTRCFPPYLPNWTAMQLRISFIYYMERKERNDHKKPNNLSKLYYLCRWPQGYVWFSIWKGLLCFLVLHPEDLFGGKKVNKILRFESSFRVLDFWRPLWSLVFFLQTRKIEKYLSINKSMSTFFYKKAHICKLQVFFSQKWWEENTNKREENSFYITKKAFLT